ncbi:MAG TPA: threonine synthase [Thermoanaerobaculia bacterium]|nr:threonine synthase [Thermoanaerobaculia bacterium]
MRLISTAGGAPEVSLAEALARGLAPDGGLYLPSQLPPLDPGAVADLKGRPLVETARRLAHHLWGDDLPAATLDRMVEDALPFEIPLRPLDQSTGILELFHGPTLAFKDVGARFLARLLAVTRPPDHPELTVLVATSGDTGGAVADAFWRVAGTRVVVLYPRGRVSPLQERQIAGLGGNVHALAVEGSFDDCQRLVKEAFLDPELAAAHHLTSANSISIGRLLPQLLYYFHAWAQLPEGAPLPLFAVPCGNLGNLTAGFLAARLGLPVAGFVAATNSNDVLPELLATGVFRPRPSLATLSNAMDVGNPSNLARLLHLVGGEAEALSRQLIASAWSDVETLEAIREVEGRFGVVLDPHSAVGWLGLERARAGRRDEVYGIVVATAHPAKFPATVEAALGRSVPRPPALEAAARRTVHATPLAPELAALREFLRTAA